MGPTLAKLLLLAVVAGAAAHGVVRVRVRSRAAPEFADRFTGLVGVGLLLSLVLAMNALPALGSLWTQAESGHGPEGPPGRAALFRLQATVLVETALLVRLAWGPIVAADPATDEGVRAAVASVLGRLAVRFALAAVGLASLFGLSGLGPLDVLRTPAALASPAALLAVETTLVWAFVRFGPRRAAVPAG